MEEAIVLYPSPQIGHLISMVEFCKLILTHQPSLKIHILNPPPPYGADSTAPYISSVSATVPSITFHQLPTINLSISSSRHHESLVFETLRLNNPNVQNALLSISKNYNIISFVIDFFSTPVFDVATALNILVYYFITFGAGCLSFTLYFPTIHKKTTKSFKDLDIHIDIPGIPPIPSSDMPKPLLERDDEIYKFVLDFATILPKSAGIIVNTFEALEPRPLKAIRDGQCVPDSPTAPIHYIGPLIATSDRSGGGSTGDSIPECLTWLDSQPSKSVVFLCFGSLGLFTVEQLKEIAIGLERSGQRFLWVVRNPPAENQSVAIKALSDPDLNLLLPEGFLDRTKQRGLVVKSWAPQIAVLNHYSVGGFVTHCGWNSILESVCAGVPMVAWPLYAEQRFNRVLLVEEIKIALPMVESENGFVNSAEVEKRVRELMELEQGKSIREQTTAMKHAAMAALSEGGSSYVALDQLIESWKHK
ncbi:hypothetical protein SLA2020_102940 [Shorea laevis]